MWWQLAIKALISGAVIAAASEFSRRSPALGGLIVSLPLVSVLAMVWLWRDTGDPQRIADLATSSSLYVIASLPAFAALAILLKRGTALPIAMAAFVSTCFAGYLLMQWAGHKWGLPV